MSFARKIHLADELNVGPGRRAEDIRYLVFHYTGNDGDTDEGNGRFFAENVVEASAHYFVDDDSATQTVSDDRVAWAVGGEKWADCAATGGGTLHGIVTNTNSLSVELCDTKRDGVLMASEATLDNAAALGRELMARYNIPAERVVRHFDVTGKHCPAYFMDEAAWNAFKERLTAEPRRYDSLEQVAAAAPWAADTVRKLCEKNILRGGDDARLDLSTDMLRLLVMNDRAGIYDI